VLAFVTEKKVVKKILEHLGLPTTGPPAAPARIAAACEDAPWRTTCRSCARSTSRCWQRTSRAPNTRRIAGALRPLLKAAPLSKSAVSRVVGTLKSELATWEKLLSDAPPHGRERIIPSGTFELVINLRANEFRIYASAEADEHWCFTGAMVSGA
jgi:hypothetical protein